MISFRVLTEEHFTVNENGHQVYDFYPNRNFDGELHMAPYYPENHDAIEYYRAFLWADKHNVQLVSYGSKNLLPFLGTISHKAVLSPAATKGSPFNFFLKTNVLHQKPGSTGNFSTNVIDLSCYNPVHELSPPPVFIGKPASPEVVASKSKKIGPPVYLNGEILYGCIDYAEKHGIAIRDKNLEAYGQLTRESPSCTKLYPTLDITDAEILKKYRNPILYVDREAYQHFEDLKDRLPKNRLWVESKIHPDYEPVNRLFDSLPDDVVLKETLWDKPFQTYLSKECPDSFLTIQLLCSALLNYQFAAIAGAANMFGMLPLNCFFLVSCDKPLFQMKELKTRLQLHQYKTRPTVYIVRTVEAWQQIMPWRSRFEHLYPFVDMKVLFRQEFVKNILRSYRPGPIETEKK